MLQPPCRAWGLAVVAGADGLWWIGEGCEEGAAVEDFEEEDEDWDAECCLDMLARCTVCVGKTYVDG